jgi:hypothetical protein
VEYGLFEAIAVERTLHLGGDCFLLDVVGEEGLLFFWEANAVHCEFGLRFGDFFCPFEPRD